MLQLHWKTIHSQLLAYDPLIPINTLVDIAWPTAIAIAIVLRRQLLETIDDGKLSYLGALDEYNKTDGDQGACVKRLRTQLFSWFHASSQAV